MPPFSRVRSCLSIIALVTLVACTAAPQAAHADQRNSDSDRRSGAGDITVRAIGSRPVPANVAVVIRQWIGSILALGDGATDNDGEALQQLSRLSAPEPVTKVARERNYAMTNPGLQAVDVIRKDRIYIAGPITFSGEYQRDGGTYTKPHIYRLHIDAASARVRQAEEIPYQRLSRVEMDPAMLPRDLYDLVDQAGLLISSYKGALEQENPERLMALMTSDARIWSVTVDQAGPNVTTPDEYGRVSGTTRNIASIVKTQSIDTFSRSLRRVFGYYDSVSVNIEDGSARLYHYIAEDGAVVDVLEFHQEFIAWRKNRIVYRDAGYTTFFLRHIENETEHGRKIARKFWSLTGVVSNSDDIPVIPNAPDVIPVASRVMFSR